jgi:uncharacterized protein YdaT
MTSDKFNELFDIYRQKAIETSAASINENATDHKPIWVRLLQRHVQEWKQHYGQESQALEQIKDNYQHIRHQADPFSPIEQMAILADQERASEVVTRLFQVKRDMIWARQQQELETLKVLA